jgi:hypothetical protein
MLYLVGNGFIRVHVGNPSAQEKPTPAVSHIQCMPFPHNINGRKGRSNTL